MFIYHILKLLKKARYIFITYELPRAITEWIGGQHKDMGEGGGKQTVIAAAGAVGSGLQQAGMNRNLSESNQDKGGKGDNTGKPEKPKKTDQSGGETRAGPTVANAKAQDEGKK